MAEGGERSKVPAYTIYRVEDAPELQAVQDALRSKGLKDPWMRNEVWRFLPSEWGTHRQRLLTFFFRGFPLGFGAFLATIALEAASKLTKGSGEGGHGGGGHGGGGHHGHEDEADAEGQGNGEDNSCCIDGGGGDKINIEPDKLEKV
ncbi:NADH dehydrogenase [ubiquinone] 1 beta subcomplex subunit 3 [Halyomorpha halys]|uniref:NADH dehydrogenase [ubiquinone] 1 beta subcomplex subunit 3 n=1 Tax=Halyomorpha halys TaxID=286706 RepID=UPI0006D5046A|nr:NADH dehydrogenase [ubiquinone] 1 beta subcomplex subunit 3-like [Halyomorpha halys]